MGWVSLDLSTDHGYAKAERVCAAIFNQSSQKHFNNEISWICGANQSDSLLLLVHDRDGTYDAFGLMIIQSRPLQFRVGEVSYLRKSLKRYELWAEPVFADHSISETAKRDCARQFVEHLWGILEPGDALSIEGLEYEGYFHQLLRTDPRLRRKFLRLQIGKLYAHQFIKMPATYTDYLDQLGKRSRKSLVYDQRRLSRDFEEDVEIRRFTDAESVNDFVEDSIEISKTTYQWHLLGLGLRDKQRLLKTLNLASRHNWMCCYILYLRKTPAAFMIGYRHEACFYYIDVGFKPEFSKWSVGSVLQMMVLQDLYDSGDPPEIFDFSTGYGEHKERFGNHSKEELNMLLLPRTLRNSLLLLLYEISESFAAGIEGVVEKIGLKRKLKRFVRRFRR